MAESVASSAQIDPVDVSHSADKSSELSELELEQKLGQVDVLVADNMIKRSASPEIERRLNEDTTALVGTCTAQRTLTPMDVEVTKLIGVFLAAQNYKVTQEFLDLITELALEYLHQTIDSIKKFTEIQRRTRPSLNDVRYAFRIRNMNYGKLYVEGIRGQKVRKVAGSNLQSVHKEIDTHLKQLEEDAHDDESDAFFINQDYEISKLVPTLVEKPDYIPSYLPKLPPDYTYQSTAEYMQTVTDSEKLRVKLVEESRLTEKSLYNLIGEDDKKGDSDTNDEETDLESLLSLAEKQVEDVATPAPRFEEIKAAELPEYAEDEEEKALRESETRKPEQDAKPFDVLAYVEKRLAIKRNHMKEVELTRKRRQENVFMQAEMYYSPYATMPITDEIQQKFDGMIEEELQNTIQAVKIGRKKQKAEIDRLKEKAKERSTETKTETIEFGFNFNDKSDSDSDDDMQDIIFGTDGESKEASKNADNGFPVFDMDEEKTEGAEPAKSAKEAAMPAEKAPVRQSVGGKSAQKAPKQAQKTVAQKAPKQAQKTVGHKTVSQKGPKPAQKTVAQKTVAPAHKTVASKSVASKSVASKNVPNKPVEQSDEDMEDEFDDIMPDFGPKSDFNSPAAGNTNEETFDDLFGEAEEDFTVPPAIETPQEPSETPQVPSGTLQVPSDTSLAHEPQPEPKIKLKLNFTPKSPQESKSAQQSPQATLPAPLEEVSDISDEDD